MKGSSSRLCQTYRRLHSTTNINNLPRIAPLPHISVLEISGPDATKFLKGLSCKDVDSLQGGYSGFLNASGRVLHTTFIIPLSSSTIPTYLITHQSPSTHPHPLTTLLPPFKLRSRVRFRDVSSEWDVFSAWGSKEDMEGHKPLERWKFGSGGAAERGWIWEGGVKDLGLKEGEVGCWDLRAGWGSMGKRVLIPKGDKPSLISSHDSVLTEIYHLNRTLLGVPEGPTEILPTQALPLESCMDIHGGIDFRKGCYLGQELTVRTYHTGATRKRILPIRLFPLSSNKPLSEIVLSPPTVSSLSTAPTLPESPPLPELSTPTSTFSTTGDLSHTSITDEESQIDITYHPPPDATLKKARSAGKILSLLPHHPNVGLGLVRIEMAERTWWNAPSVGSVTDWAKGNRGRLIANVHGEEMGVYVGMGEAYNSASQFEKTQGNR
ncbi:mitochondrial protein [Tremella mesenterica]|uniref:Mitochondrial protein n=1 Tax=Tremella mesenterica TaxID=5217 RepID=A0A4Q1BGJ4_TREME|nr:uncharacterized protein TREMEDRAFT_73002 [Tremella mesenterica DSM 1558]EIW73166.1 hypothetical protein TREMEDRAFT_73002 [Tremella mesenterica DSM 1558]RXK36692.1 mitochondrial protein [Tremella mesenterica]